MRVGSSRRKLLARLPGGRIGAALVASIVLTGCWLQPGFGPHRTGHNWLESRLTRANVASLTPAWSVDFGDAPVDAPVISTSGVHVVAGLDLHTRRLADGTVRWSVPVFDDESELPASLGPPSVRDDNVLAPLWVYRNFAPGSGTHAYDAASGADKGVVSSSSSASVTVAGDTLVGRHLDVGSGIFASWLYVTNVDEAQQSWRTIVSIDSDGGPDTSAAVGSDRVILGHRSSVVAYTRAKPAQCEEPSPGIQVCTPAWTRVLSGTATTPVLDDEHHTVYVGDGAGVLWALNANDGTVRWSADIGAGQHAIQAPPTLGDGRLFVTTSDGRLYAFAAGGCGAPTCAATWIAATGSAISEQAALAGGVVYVGSDNGNLDAFAAAGCGAALCAPVWEASTGSRITGAPAVAFGRLVVGTADGRLIAYEPS